MNAVVEQLLSGESSYWMTWLFNTGCCRGKAVAGARHGGRICAITSLTVGAINVALAPRPCDRRPERHACDGWSPSR